MVSLAMNARTLPPLAGDLVHSTWSSWTPLSKLHEPRRPTLPPISDLALTVDVPHVQPPPAPSISMAPMTSLSAGADTPVKLSPHLPPFQETFPDSRDSLPSPSPEPPSLPPPQLVDWLDGSWKRSAPFIAEKTAEMICYLWFADGGAAAGTRSTALQLGVSSGFVGFVQKVLETTQVSQSVIVLSLHYIYRLKERNRLRSGQAGSEFRIAVAALMMANKFLDDNTYTNKTWAEVSGIGLSEINKMEREFLQGVNFSLYVDSQTYDSWLNLLRGLVLAKDRDARTRTRRATKVANAVPSLMPSPGHRTPGRTSRPTRTRHYHQPHHTHRARSISPTAKYPSYAPLSHSRDSPTPMPHSPSKHSVPASALTPLSVPGSKRTACAAFSPTSAQFPASVRPSKRPVTITLEIPERPMAGGYPSAGASPLEPLNSFARMTLDGGSPASASPGHSLHPEAHWASSGSTTSSSSSSSSSSGSSSASSESDAHPHTLLAGYRAEHPVVPPQNLYYYSLACSPLDTVAEEDLRWRKSRLRAYQPQPTHMAAQPHPTSQSLSHPRAPSIHLPHIQAFPHIHVTSQPASKSHSNNAQNAAYVLPPIVHAQEEPSPTYDDTHAHLHAHYVYPHAQAPAYAYQSAPTHVQSANVSPARVHGPSAAYGYYDAAQHGTASQPPALVLPRLDEGVWTRHRRAADQYEGEGEDENGDMSMKDDAPPTSWVPAHDSRPRVPSAPFANAGPPGVHFYAPQAYAQQHQQTYTPARPYARESQRWAGR